MRKDPTMTEERIDSEPTAANPVDTVEDQLGDGVAYACTQVLHKTLQDFQVKLVELQRLKEQWYGLAHWIRENQRGACQLATFLRGLGGDQDRYWHVFQDNARRTYHMPVTELHKILSGKFDLSEYLKPVVSAEMPF
jgi:hypothetical protein